MHESMMPLVARSSRWPAVSRAHLAQFPECAACGGKTNVRVHHIKPVHAYPELELEPKNLVTLCQRDTLNCHLFFGHLGDWRSWNKHVRRDALRFKARVLTRPYKTVESREPPVEGQQQISRAECREGPARTQPAARPATPG